MTIIRLIIAAKGLVMSGPGPLVRDGWVRSYLERQSVDRAGNPIPWITYSAIDFLSGRLPKLERVFEYGSGNGTRWWAGRSIQVNAVENDIGWYEKMKKLIPPNVDLFFEQLDNGTSYEERILVDQGEYDVIIIDGRRRNKCMCHSLKKIKPNGVIILDNSDRTEYEEGISHLMANGFRRIDFSGFCPIVNIKSQTAIFYRNQNILGI
jgi:hypothetical protein